MKKLTDDFNIYRRHLPHFRSRGRIYFVTWRLAKGQTDLTAQERTPVADALKHFDGTRYDLFGYVVMNDHVHVLVYPEDKYQLEDITHSWKSFTAHQIVDVFGRQPPLWQHESFDRIVRYEAELYEKMQYIMNDPFKRWPERESYEWM